MKKLLFVEAVASVVLLGGLTAFADYAIYSGGDIAAAGVSPEEHNTRILFGGSGWTWTLSQDYTIHSGGFAEAGSLESPKTVTFDFTDGNHTLTLASGNFLIYNSDVIVDFKGGTWDFGGTQTFTAYNSSGGANNRVTLDACTFADVFSFGGLNNTNSWWQLKNGTAYTGKSTFNAFSAGDCTGSMIELSGGSTMTIKDFAMRSGYRSDDPKAYEGATFRVTGAGTKFEHGGSSFMIGHGYNGDTFEVADHATAKIGYPRFGYKAATRNTGFYVHDGGTLTSVNSMGFGSQNAASAPYVAANGGLFAKVTDGGTFKSGADGTGDFIMGSENNLLFVSNATFACSTFRVGQVEGATGNVVRVLGKDTSFTANWSSLFGNGGQNLVEIGDQANVTVGALSFDSWDGASEGAAYHSPSNVVRVTGGATLAATSYLIGNAKTDLATGNRIEITDGGKMTVTSSSTVAGTNNWLLVDNGTFESTQNTVDTYGRDTAGVNFGQAYNGRTSDGCTLIIRGDRPKVKILKTSLKFDLGSKLRFELPPNGYQYATEGEAPLELLQIMNYTMDYEIAGLDELQKNLPRACDIPLIKLSSRMWDGGTAFAALNRINAKLAETNPGCRLWKQDNRGTTGGEIIYLHVKAFPGLMLIVR